MRLKNNTLLILNNSVVGNENIKINKATKKGTLLFKQVIYYALEMNIDHTI